jgi:hypothetical protein
MRRFAPYSLSLRVVRGISLFISILALVVLTRPAAAAPPGPKHPTLVRGQAEAKAGYQLAGADGAEWSLPGGPTVRATPRSMLRLLPTPQSINVGGGTSRAGYTVMLESGQLTLAVPDGSKSAIILTTPRKLDAIVKLGRARVVVSEKDAAVVNDRGEPSTSSAKGSFHPLAEGMVHDSVAGVRARVVNPTRIDAKLLRLAADGASGGSDIRWSDVPGAAGYHVELIKDGADHPLVSTDTTAPRLERTIALETGGYSLSVVARDPTGLDAEQPLIASIHVVDVALPKGAYRDPQGAILLPKDQRVKLVGTDGLEMTFGASKHWVPASPTLGLVRDEPTLVRLRLPSSGDSLSFRLEPRTVRARIEMSPRTATWPRDPITIRIRLDDGRRPVPAWLRAIPRVSVGIEPVRVAFTKKKGWLTARVAPRRGSGPWVVRVEVQDQFGIPLGRDLLEVVRRAQ